MKRGSRVIRQQMCLLVVLILTLVVCLKDVRAETAKVVKLGDNTALSGGAAFWGVGYDNAFKLAAKKINSSGNFVVAKENYRWEIVACDHRYSTSEAVSCANKLIYRDKVKYMTVMGGAPGIAVAPITTKEKVLQVCWAGGDKALTNPNHPLVFRHSPVDVAAAQMGLYRWLMGKKDVKNLATIHPDDETGYSAGEGCKEAAKVTGLKLLSQDYFARGTMDFYPVLSRMISKKPDFIDMVFCDFKSVAMIGKQLHELKYPGIVILWIVDPVKSLEMMGAEILEGYYSYLTLAKMITPEQQNFYKMYVEEYKEWNEQALLAYDFLFTLTDCIVQGQTFDPVKVAEIMQDKEIPYLYGKGRYGMEKKFGIKRQGLFPTPLAQFKDGAWRHVSFIEPEIP